LSYVLTDSLKYCVTKKFVIYTGYVG